MARNYRPDVIVPDNEFRCQAMVKAAPYTTWQKWCHEPHRCVRRANQCRDGHIVCWQHGAQEDITYWDGKPDAFIKKVGKRRYRVPVGVGASW